MDRPGLATRPTDPRWAALRRLGLGLAIMLAGLDLVSSNRIHETRADQESAPAAHGSPSTRGELRALAVRDAGRSDLGAVSAPWPTPRVHLLYALATPSPEPPSPTAVPPTPSATPTAAPTATAPAPPIAVLPPIALPNSSAAMPTLAGAAPVPPTPSPSPVVIVVPPSPIAILPASAATP